MLTMTTTKTAAAITASIMFKAAHRQDGVARAMGGMADALRKVGRRMGGINPIGVGNSKTQSPGAYRPVGASCPACPHEEECYATVGRTELQQRRASADLVPSLNAAAAVFTMAVAHGTMARLQVSGDWGADLDLDLVNATCDIADAVNQAFGRPIGTPIAWTYTHHKVTPAADWIQKLNAHGIYCRVSDYRGPGGAIVEPFERFAAVRAELAAAGHKAAKCRAQIQESASCATCELCWKRPDLVIVFTPEGSKASAMKQRLLGG